MDGSASSQETVHFLKLASQKYQVELENLRLQKELTAGKSESLKSVKRSEELMQEALKAFRSYAAQGESDED
jgi:hypothetical protein